LSRNNSRRSLIDTGSLAITSAVAAAAPVAAATSKGQMHVSLHEPFDFPSGLKELGCFSSCGLIAGLFT
jgi:hypothetical protein